MNEALAVGRWGRVVTVTAADGHLARPVITQIKETIMVVFFFSLLFRDVVIKVVQENTRNNLI